MNGLDVAPAAPAAVPSSGRIQKLPAEVVNRIGAGEVIQRPRNALKELIENALDAGAQNITVVVLQGGLKLLQITDDGCGIPRDDLPKLCERHTTSKLTEFDDLKSLQTFGFRGEALASIALVSQLTVTSCTATQECAFRVRFQDGKLQGEPQPVAGVRGTSILVEELFYRDATRRKALQNVSDEYARIQEVVRAYALHNPHCSFALKKHGESLADVRTLGSAVATFRSSIRQLFGAAVELELLETDTDLGDGCQVRVCLSRKGTADAKRKSVFVFVNRRWVEIAALRKAVKIALGPDPPASPFALVSLTVPPAQLDVNVHPTKEVVHFAHEARRVEQFTAHLADIVRLADEQRPPEQQQHDSEPPAPSTPRRPRTTSPLTPGSGSVSRSTPSTGRSVGATALSALALGEPTGEPTDENAAPPAAAPDVSVSLSSSRAPPKAAARAGASSSTSSSAAASSASSRRTSPLAGSKRPHEEQQDDDLFQSPRGSKSAATTVPVLLQRTLLGGVISSAPSPIASKTAAKVKPAAAAASGAVADPFDKRLPDPATGAGDGAADIDVAAQSFASRTRPHRRYVMSDLTSVQNLTARAVHECHPASRLVLQRATLVCGSLANGAYSVLNSDSTLWLLANQPFSTDLAYQLVLRKFAQFDRVWLDPGPPLQPLLEHGLQHPASGWESSQGTREAHALQLAAQLVSRADMLADYFGVVLHEARVQALPQVFEQHLPSLHELPLFLVRLAQCSYSDEQQCFEDVARALASFCAVKSSSNADEKTATATPAPATAVSSLVQTDNVSVHVLMRDVILPELKSAAAVFAPPRAWVSGNAADRVLSVLAAQGAYAQLLAPCSDSTATAAAAEEK